ncbi:MAG: hypothetical protein JW870_21500 [Candidatus Delongbacteria bacterium]|nr:hypothetical protein [Candidatus Delongbacteria bacterium]
MKLVLIFIIFDIIFCFEIIKTGEFDWADKNVKMEDMPIFDNSGNYYLVTSENCEILKVDSNNRIVIRKKYFGNGPGELVNPTCTLFNNNCFYVYDANKVNINIYDINLNFLSSINVGSRYLSFKPIHENLVLANVAKTETIDKKITIKRKLILLDKNFQLVKELIELEKVQLFLKYDIDFEKKEIYLIEDSFDMIVHVFDFEGNEKSVIRNPRPKIKFSKTEVKNEDYFMTGRIDKSYKYSIQDLFVYKDKFILVPGFQVFNDEDRLKYKIQICNRDLEEVQTQEIDFIKGSYYGISGEIVKYINGKLIVNDLFNGVLSFYEIIE